MQKPHRASYTAAEFLDWTSSKALVLSPKFQRRGVWQPAARSFFIDTLLRSMPVPPVYLRMTQSPLKNKVVREVIDGQQRIAAVVRYLTDDFALSGVSSAEWKGKKFSQLTAEEQSRIRDYAFSAEVFSSLSDAEVLEIFSRLNTYAVKLNDQELRNGKFFGQFKQTVYRLGLEHLEFWRAHGIFSERGIARMEEAELVSELLIAGMAGLQDKKKSIDAFYAEYEETFPKKNEAVSRFKAVLSQIAELMPEPLNDTQFKRRPLFYTLYTTTYHRMFGVPNIPFKTSRAGVLSAKEQERLAAAVSDISDALENIEEQPSNKAIAAFVAASLRQTDNLKPRTERLSALYVLAFQ
ncbi:MAG: DUF262 domain-containing protein [Rhodocyclaceae bacterium]|nr:DUF262 domain-containing protein [Rhodocyclaceae bacterium]